MRADKEGMARMLMTRRLLVLAAFSTALLTSGTASAATPACTIRGTDRSETLTGTAGRDVICGMGGNDRLRGMGGDDVLLGGDGHDVLEGGAGNDDLQGEKGNDALAGGDGNDSLSGGDGHDALVGGGGKDTLDGGGGEDAFLGGPDTDVVNAKDDRRDAFIDCGAGKDSLTADKKDPKGRDCEGAVTPPPPPPAPKADLSVSLTDSADPVVLGNTVEYHFTVQNAGPAAATGVMVSTTLPADATADAATGCAADAAVVTCSLGDVPSGGSAAGTLVVRYGSTGAKTVTSVVNSAVEDPNAANNSASQATQVDPEARADRRRRLGRRGRAPGRGPARERELLGRRPQRRPAGRRRGLARVRHRRGVERDHAPHRLHAVDVPDHQGDLQPRLAGRR